MLKNLFTNIVPNTFSYFLLRFSLFEMERNMSNKSVFYVQALKSEIDTGNQLLNQFYSLRTS